MLAVVAGADARLDPGSVALALARRISEAGEPVLFIDADASGAKMAQRLGEAAEVEYLPALRGLPSLMVCRQPLTLRLLADHCYSLETSGDPLWALFAPSHPEGAALAAEWLADRADDLAAIGAHRRVVVSGRLGGHEPLAPLLAAAPVALTVAPVQSPAQAEALRVQARDGGLLTFERGRRALLVEGDSPMTDDDIALAMSMHVVARLAVTDDERLLRPAGRRDRRIANTLGEVADKLLVVWDANPPALTLAPAPPGAADNGAPAAGPLSPQPSQEHLADEAVLP